MSPEPAVTLPAIAIYGLANAILADDIVMAAVFAVMVLMGLEQAQEAARVSIRGPWETAR
jgi:hypothetical protein